MTVALKSVPSVAELAELIRNSGSGESTFFGYDLLSDGLYLQQDPPEFAEFVHYMSTTAAPSELSIDIGIASGGQTKFLRDFYACRKTIIVDLGQHPDAKHWPRIKQSVNSEIVLEIFDDSHSSIVREKLKPYRGIVDFAYVDGDHSYRGLRKDIFLVKELLRSGALLALHDTKEVPECKRVYDEMLKSESFQLVRDFVSRFGISLWQVKKPSASNLLNRQFGVGGL